MRTFFAVILLALAVSAEANVVRLAPDFMIEGAGRGKSLRGLRGQPVVLLVAKSSRVGAFKKQVRVLEEIYQQFASRQAVFVAAVREGDTEARSNIPFAIAINGSKIAADYGVEDDFAIIIIGKDGNVDLQTPKVISASRVRDVIMNSFEMQAAERK